MSYKVTRTTWGESIRKSKEIRHFNTEAECEAYILRDALRLTNIGYEFKGHDGVRNSCGWKDYCHYDID